MIFINRTSKICLIDLSYFIFYRYFALKKWMSFSGKELDEDEFIEKFKKLFVQNLKKICKTLKIEPKNTILVGDCFRKNIWRNKHYPEYKQNRENKINKNIFMTVYETIIPELKDFQYIHLDELEADDICYIMTKYLENEIVIITNDNDYLQMINEKTIIVNLPLFKSICGRCNNNAKEGLLTKVLVGDRSDNIKGIVSKQIACSLISNESELPSYMKENNLEESFNLNMLLIDMSNIPEELVKNVKNCISFI